MSERKPWHFDHVLHVNFQLHLVERTPLCADKTVQTYWKEERHTF